VRPLRHDTVALVADPDVTALQLPDDWRATTYLVASVTGAHVRTHDDSLHWRVGAGIPPGGTSPARGIGNVAAGELGLFPEGFVASTVALIT